jgi:predicted amidophosphoribosyltransferase
MDEEACKNALFRICWPRGFSCARCGCTRYYPVSGRGQYECALCGRQFSLTGGTCMHKTRLPLRKWFEAAALYSADRTISAAEFARKLELTKPTAWLLLKKIKQGLTSGERILLGKIAPMWITRTHETQRGKTETRR